MIHWQYPLHVERELVHARRRRELVGKANPLSGAGILTVGVADRLHESRGKWIGETAVRGTATVYGAKELADLRITERVEPGIGRRCPVEPVPGADRHLIVHRPRSTDTRSELSLTRIQDGRWVTVNSRIHQSALRILADGMGGSAIKANNQSVVTVRHAGLPFVTQTKVHGQLRRHADVILKVTRPVFHVLIELSRRLGSTATGEARAKGQRWGCRYGGRRLCQARILDAFSIALTNVSNSSRVE